MEEGDDGYIARITAAYEQRNMEFTLIVSDDMSEITGMSFTPEYTIAEKMAKAAMNTLIGMGVVFLVLIFISWIISLFKYINVFEAKMKGQEKQEKPAGPGTRGQPPAPAPVQPAPAPAPAAAPVQAAAPAVSNAAPAYEYEDVSGRFGIDLRNCCGDCRVRKENRRPMAL